MDKQKKKKKESLDIAKQLLSPQSKKWTGRDLNP